jgi:hypothetical protein
MPRPFVLSPTALRVLAITALSLSWLSACGKAEEAAQEAAAEAAIEAMSDAEVDVEDGGQTISGVDEQGNAFSVSQGEAARLPADFPDDLLVPEGFVPQTAMQIEGNAFVAGTAPGELASLTDAITKHMKGEGWAEMMSANEPDKATSMWQRDKRMAVYVIERQDEGQLTLSINHTPAPAETSEEAPTP